MRIRWTRPAAGDLTQICDYIEKHGSAAIAWRVALSIYQHVAALAGFLERGLAYPE
jgi:plasmid stabilization system protein ParE